MGNLNRKFGDWEKEFERRGEEVEEGYKQHDGMLEPKEGTLQ